MYIGNVNLDTVVGLIAFVIVFPMQLILCHKVKSIAIRLIPIIIFAALIVITLIASSFCVGWDGFFYLVCAVYFAFMIVVCGIAWGIWHLKSLLVRNYND